MLAILIIGGLYFFMGNNNNNKEQEQTNTSATSSADAVKTTEEATSTDANKEMKKLASVLKKTEIALSQLTYSFQQANEIVKHLVLQNYILQKRTGGQINDEELRDGQQELQSKYDERHKNLKQSKIQSEPPGRA